jgi:hypothetical protein
MVKNKAIGNRRGAIDVKKSMKAFFPSPIAYSLSPMISYPSPKAYRLSPIAFVPTDYCLLSTIY